MKKLILSVALFALLTTGLLCGQMGPANIAGTLYASNFTGWTVAQGNNGPFSWSSSSVCTAATSGGVTFQPFHVGTPIAILDGTSPTLNEIVTPTAVNINGSGCSITVNPVHQHFSFFLATATAGLQEAINYANGRSYLIYVTPDFTRSGGTTATITNALGNTQVTVLDQRSSVIVPYLWNGTNYAPTPFGGGTPAPPQFAVQLANAGANGFAADPNITINPTSHIFATPTIASFNPVNALNMGAQASTTSDFTLRNNAGNVTNEPFPLARPWVQFQTVNRRYGPAQATNPLSSSLFLLSGMDNTNVVQGDYGMLGLNVFSLTPQQGGGIFSMQGQCRAVGDCVGTSINIFGRGISREEDEGTECCRTFYASTNDTAGGTLTAISTDAQGANPIATAIITNSFSTNYYEKSFILDVTKKWQSPGNIASIGTATDNRFSFFQGDGTAGITAQYGISTQTLLTSPIDNFVYTGTCGSQTVTAAQYPISGITTGANDGFMTNYQGVGAPGENTNYNSTTGALTGFCATVASTAGMSAGTLVFIADADYQVEFTRVIAVADGTHFTAFMRQPHSTGATVNFGGAIGNCIGADIDITPAGTNSTTGNTQFAVQRLCYPIVQSFAGDRVNVYTNPEGSSTNNLRTYLPAANTPKVPLTITAPVVTGGILTGFTANDVIGNANNYIANNTGTGNSGHPSTLPVPTVTIGGCTVAPTLTWTQVNGNVGLTYAPSIATGGSGCGTVTFTIAQSFPTPFGIYPLAMVYKSEDPTQPAGVVNPINDQLTDGNPVLMPFNLSAWSAGDVIMAPDWWNGQGVSSQDNFNGNSLHMLDGRNGPMGGHRFSGVGNGFARDLWENDEPTAHYYGSFANNYAKFLSSDYLVLPPSWEQLDGQFGVDLKLGFPPLTANSGVLGGGSIIQVNCSRDQQATTVDPPCLHGIDYQYNIFNGIIGLGHNLCMFANHTAGSIGVGCGALTFQAPTLTAYDTSATTADVVLMGAVFSGPGVGPCSRYDLLLTSTGNAFGQSYSRICGWVDANGSTLGDLSFQTANAGGSGTYATPLLLNANAAKFSVPITSTVATGTAPLSIASTTLVPNLNASEVGGVALSGLCQTSGTGCHTGLTTTFTITTTTGTCSFTYTQGLLTTKTGSC